MEIFIDPFPPCISDFSYMPDSNNNFTIIFNDESSNGAGGMPTNWIWDFGDGNISLLQDPTHTYNAPGTYNVCLFILDTLYHCSAISCQEVIVDDSSSPLIASFTASLDSLLPMPNLYHFTSTSAGNIDSWHWDFGDGNTAEGPQVTHQFSEPGNYNVCLTVENLVTQQSDTYCAQISTPEYAFFGGQVFAGNFPLNNPSPTGDTGIAYLFKIYENSVLPVDTNQFTNEGLYAFNHLLNGNYMVKVRLTENSTNYGKFFPTYFPDRLTWQESQMMTLSEPYYSADIQLIPAATIAYGLGAISGRVEINENERGLHDDGQEVFEVLLLGSSGDPLTYTYTDGSGNFGFDELPYGTYRLFADHTGWTSNSKTVTLGQSNISANNIILTLEFEGSYGIEGPGPEGEIDLVIYPNPVREILNLSFKAPDEGLYEISIFDPAGRAHKFQSVYFSRNISETALNVGNLPGGIYILRLTSANGKYHSVKRFVR
jgi:PKD repeat protein